MQVLFKKYNLLISDHDFWRNYTNPGDPVREAYTQFIMIILQKNLQSWNSMKKTNLILIWKKL